MKFDEASFLVLIGILKEGVNIVTIREASISNIAAEELVAKGYWKELYRPVAVTSTGGGTPHIIKWDDYQLTPKGIRIRNKLCDPLQKLVAINELRKEFNVHD